MSRDIVLVSSPSDRCAYVYAQQEERLREADRVPMPGGPGALCVNAARTRLYAAMEDASVGAWAILDGPRFEPLATAGSGHPLCWIGLTPDENALLGAAYHAGCAVTIPLDAKGIPEAGGVRQYETAFSAHCAAIPPGGGWCFVPHTETFRIHAFRLETRGVLIPHSVIPAPMGPRHLVFDPGSRWAWSSNERTSTVTRWSVDGGSLTQLETISSLPPGFSGENTGSHILRHPSGRFLYASNRGHDSVAVFAAGSEGILRPAGFIPTDREPRVFGFDASGRHLITAGLRAGRLRVGRIREDGLVDPCGSAPAGSDALWVMGLRLPGAAS